MGHLDFIRRLKTLGVWFGMYALFGLLAFPSFIAILNILAIG
jgi:hypothetical protein